MLATLSVAAKEPRLETSEDSKSLIFRWTAQSGKSSIKLVNAKGKVVFGSTVTVVDLENNEETKYKIVGEDEADIQSNLISYSSPIARALIGKSEGEDIIFQAPGGQREYEIISVEYI